LNKSRNLENLVRTVREELRAEGPDGGGYSDFFIENAINNALADLADIYDIRDTAVITTAEGQNSYDLGELLDHNFENIIRVDYDGRQLNFISLDEYMGMAVKDEGAVRYCLLWGTNFIITGEVEEDKELTLWYNRSPKLLDSKDEEPETPFYLDEAIVQYAVSACYREANNYDRANYHFRIYLNQKTKGAKRASPQGQRQRTPKVSDSYWGPFRGRFLSQKSDTNPGGGS